MSEAETNNKNNAKGGFVANSLSATELFAEYATEEQKQSIKATAEGNKSGFILTCSQPKLKNTPGL